MALREGSDCFVEVGQGAAGIVYWNRSTNTAFKVGPTDVVERELGMMKLVGNSVPGFVRFSKDLKYDKFFGKGKAAIELQFYPRGDLFDLVRFGGPVNSLAARVIFQCLLQTVGLMHNAKVSHRDLKPENVMVSNKGMPVIIDAGSCVHADKDEPGVFTWGTDAYMHPEIYERDARAIVHGPEADVFALAIILFMLLTGRSPWQHPVVTHDAAYRALVNDNLVLFWQIQGAQKGTVVSERAKHLLNGMLVSREQRWTLEQVYKSSWVRGQLPRETEYMDYMANKQALRDAGVAQAAQEEAAQEDAAQEEAAQEEAVQEDTGLQRKRRPLSPLACNVDPVAISGVLVKRHKRSTTM